MDPSDGQMRLMWAMYVMARRREALVRGLDLIYGCRAANDVDNADLLDCAVVCFGCLWIDHDDSPASPAKAGAGAGVAGVSWLIALQWLATANGRQLLTRSRLLAEVPARTASP